MTKPYSALNNLHWWISNKTKPDLYANYLY